MLKITQLLKNLLIIFPITLVFSPLKKAFLFLAYLMDMNIWINQNKKQLVLKNPLSLKRNHNLRYGMYEQVGNHFQLNGKKIIYLEFGVATGNSFKWWLNYNSQEDSKYFGFDTFEGLPEKWGVFYEKGAMMSAIPNVEDNRANFIKGIFQDTLTGFIENNKKIIEDGEIRIIHCDADLYSATIFTLSQLYPFLKKGDLIFFDEFNVPLHEYKAFKEFTGNFYIHLKPIAQVNTFYQTAFMVD